jgi:ribose transport system permease protein
VTQPTAQVAAAAGRAGAAAPEGVWQRLRRRAADWAPAVVLLGICVALAVLNPAFMEPRNLVRVANSASIPLILAIGATFIIAMGSIDLSVEGVMSLGTMIVAMLAANDANANDFGWWAPLLAVLAASALGAVNGIVHVGLRIPSFMATLGIWFVGRGIANTALGGSAVRVMDPSIRDLALHRMLGVPFAVWIAIACFLFALGVERLTRFGRYVFAIGGGEDIAELSGIAVRRVRVMAFTLAGFFYGIAAVLAAAQLGQSNAVIADGRLFMTVTAVVVGGTALTGGEGGVLNTLIGVLIVGVLANGMVLLGVSPYVHQAVQGLMIIGAVALSTRRSRLQFVK